MLPVALTIAGSDSSGGAGIQADLRTFAALEVFGTSAITAVTAQNTLGVRAVQTIDPDVVVQQIDAVLDDLPVRSIKTGMLATAPIIEAVGKQLVGFAGDVVVDPVMVAKSGHRLLADDAVAALVRHLLPRARIVTPNLDEAEVLVGFAVRSVDEQIRAAEALIARGARAALIKGGHGSGDPIDVLLDGAANTLSKHTAPRQHTAHTHGTGCTFAAAIAAWLARGASLDDAVTRAHAFVQEAIRQAPGLGRGHGPLHHMHPWYPARRSGTPTA